ncbi:MAG: hypothetical protein WC763_07095 [Candidatus Paceibacterota bacterium]|jgi:hypothetical protein
MNTPNFTSILSRPASETERPKPLPVGSYTALISGLPRFDKSSKKQTDFVEFTLKLLSAHDDVDAEELATMGGVADKTIKDTYYLTETALWRLKDFLANAGLDVDSGNSYNELIEATPGQQIGISIRHEASQDGQSIFARIGKTFAVE